jgi:hypothetical protein
MAIREGLETREGLEIAAAPPTHRQVKQAVLWTGAVS